MLKLLRQLKEAVWNRLFLDLGQQDRDLAADAPSQAGVRICVLFIALRHSDL
ncbi:MAG TPA: hypothetical protein VHG11_12760 [Pseudorhizobium sp.]|nr:hypothetical protein [Pseudorhizobium sp.]